MLSSSAPVALLSILAPTSTTAGAAFSITVEALDLSSKPATGYTGTVHFTTTDSGSAAVVPADYTFTAMDNGRHTFTGGVTLVTAGSQTVRVIDTTTAGITGSVPIAVSAAAATQLTLVVAGATVGVPFYLTVAAQDPFGNTDPGYSGTVHFSSSDAQALLPADAPLPNGISYFSITLLTPGPATITATDTTTARITGSTSVVVTSATHFGVSAPTSVMAGSTFNLTVTALDQVNQVVTDYGGTVNSFSTDPTAHLPSPFPFTTADRGTHSFPVMFQKAGTQTITFYSGTLRGTTTITITPAPASAFVVSGLLAPVPAGTVAPLTVSAEDTFGNIDVNYRGTVAFFSTDSHAVLPGSHSFTAADGGRHVFPIILNTGGRQTLVVSDGSGAQGMRSGALVTGLTLASATPALTGTATAITLPGFIQRDANLFALALAAGDVVSATVSTQGGGGALDSYLRVFAGSGQQLAANDNRTGRDAGLTFQAPAAGTYYVGVSGSDNTTYDPLVAGAARGSATGLFDLHLSKTNAPRQPDLVGESFQVTGGPAGWGDAVTVNYTIANRGGIDAGPFSVEVRLSADNRIEDDPSDPVLTTFAVARLAAGGTASGTLRVTLPGGPGNPPAGFPEPGQVFLGLRLDPDQVVAESNTANNSSQGQGTDYGALAVVTSQAEAEPNDTFAQAAANGDVGLNTRVVGTLNTGDVDTILVSVPQDGRLTAQVHAVGLPTRLSLFNASGGLLVQSDGQGPGDPNDLIDQHLAGGTSYFLRVEGLGGAAGSYTLTTQFQPAAAPLQPLGVDSFPASVASGDFNGDGSPDLVVANFGSYQYVSVLLGNGDGTFQDRVDYAVGSAPSAVVVGDFNGDGILDLATANYGSNDVSVLLGNGDGTFGAPTRSLVGAFPEDIVAADFNGDGVLDLATTNLNSDDVSVLLGNNDGTFQDQQRFKVGHQPIGLVAGDFNGDGSADLAVGNTGSPDVSVLLGNGKGTFQAEQRYPIGGSAYGISAGDFNGDGILDLVTANDSGNDVSVLLGRGDGTFQGQTTYAAGDHPVAVIIADFNGDGIPDLATANFRSNDVSVLLGQGDGTFAAATAYGVGIEPFALTAGDFDGDGHADLAVANEQDGTVSVLVGLGDGKFHSRPVAGAAPVASAEGDFNGDGHLDLAVSNLGTSAVSVFLGRGDGTFQNPLHFDVGAKPFSIVTGDFNGDGILDLAVTNYLDSQVSVLLGQGDGTFSAPTQFLVGLGPIYLVAGDFNGDGHLDLATANFLSNDVSVLLGTGDGFQPERRFAAGAGPDYVGAGDFDGDGHLDLAVANYNHNTVSVLLGWGDGTFQDQFVLPMGASPAAVAIGDFNGDGTLDLAASNNSVPGTVTVRLGNGDGTFQDPASYLAGEGNFVTAADFNGDGILDLAVPNYDAGTMNVLLGNGDGTFQDQAAYPVGAGTFFVAAGDFNEDRYPDLVSANSLSNDITVLQGQGDGTFLSQETYPVGDYPWALAAGDFNRDGHLDLAAANGAGSTFNVLLGTGGASFGAATPAPAYANPTAVARADFNGDGRLDLAAINNIGYGLGTVLLGRGDGTFAINGYFYAGQTPVALVTGDFNGDGVPDLASANFTSRDVTVLLTKNQGTFLTFTPSATVALGEQPVALVTGDFNGDGRLDLAVADYLAGDVAVLLGNGDGTFQDPRHFAVGGHPAALVARDFNGDGHLDLAAVLPTSGDLVLLGGEGNGTFAPPLHLHVGGQPAALVADDFDRDGHLDLAVADTAGNAVVVLRGQGAGTFAAPLRFTVGTGPVALVAGDVNGDGHEDLATANQRAPFYSVLLGLGDGTFLPGDAAVGPIRSTPVVADLNGDGAPDVAVLNQAGQILFRPGVAGAPGQFGPPVVINPDSPARDLALVQTGTGPALAALDASGSALSLYVPGPDDSFTRTMVPTPQDGLPVALAAGDLNGEGDGLDDLVAVQEVAGSVQIVVFRQGPAGHFSAVPAPASLPGVSPSALTLADVNGDGRLDVVVADRASGDLNVLLNDPRQPFAAVLRFRGGTGLYGVEDRDGTAAVSSGEEPAAVVAGPFDERGGTDLVVTAGGSDHFSILTASGVGGLFNPPSPLTYLTGSNPTAVVAGRFDGDRHLDLAVLNQDSATISVFRGDGQGGFTEQVARDAQGQQVPLEAGNIPTGLSVADVNRDGKLDLLVGNQFGDVLVLFGNGDGTFQPYQRVDRNVALAVVDGQHLLLADQGQDRLVRQDVTGAASAAQVVPANQGSSSLTVQSDIGGPGSVIQDRNDGIRAPTGGQIVTVGTVQYYVVANSGANDVLVYPLVNSQPDPSAVQTYFTGTDPVSITVVALNDDPTFVPTDPSRPLGPTNPGRLVDLTPDLVVTNRGSNDVSILLGHRAGSSWTLSAGPRLQSGGIGPTSTLVEDVTSPGGGGPDGIPDLVISNSQSNNLAVLPGVGGGFFNDQGQQPPISLPSAPGEILPFAADPRGGVVLNPADNTITLFTDFADPTTRIVLSSGGTTPVTAIDVEQNGLSGLLVANDDGVLSLLLSGPNGLSEEVFSTDLLHPSDLALAELGNGTLEVFATQEGVESVARLTFQFESGLPVPLGNGQGTGLPGALDNGPDEAGQRQQVADLTPFNGTSLSLVPVLVTGTRDTEGEENNSTPLTLFVVAAVAPDVTGDEVEEGADRGAPRLNPETAPDVPKEDPKLIDFFIGLDRAIEQLKPPAPLPEADADREPAVWLPELTRAVPALQAAPVLGTAWDNLARTDLRLADLRCHLLMSPLEVCGAADAAGSFRLDLGESPEDGWELLVGQKVSAEAWTGEEPLAAALLAAALWRQEPTRREGRHRALRATDSGSRKVCS